MSDFKHPDVFDLGDIVQVNKLMADQLYCTFEEANAMAQKLARRYAGERWVEIVRAGKFFKVRVEPLKVMIPWTFKGEGGFTLIEVCISMLLALVVASLLATMMTATARFHKAMSAVMQDEMTAQDRLARQSLDVTTPISGVVMSVVPDADSVNCRFLMSTAIGNTGRSLATSVTRVCP